MNGCKICEDIKNGKITIESSQKLNAETTQNSNKLGITTVTNPTSNQFVNALSWGGTKWNWSQGSTNKLTYYFGTGASAANCPAGVTALNGSAISTAAWTTAEKNALVVALKKWTDLIGMNVQEVTNVNDADLKLYITTENVGYLGAQYGPHSPPYQGTGIYVRYAGNTWTNSLSPGGYGFITLIHELGHGLGLAHPHDKGGGSSEFPGVTSSSSLGDNSLNQNVFTVMSYNDTNSPYEPSSAQAYGFSKGPMGFDIATIKYLYGLNPSYNNGNNTYTITEGTVKGVDGYTCVYDTGSEDLIIYNGTKKVTIDLRPATLTNQVGGGGYVSKVDSSTVYSGYTIANGAVIENATGGSNDDSIIQVDSVANVIDGRGGVDTVSYVDAYSSYTVKDISGDGKHIEVSKGNVKDVLYNIEKLSFSDGIVNTNNLGEVEVAGYEVTYTSNIPAPGIAINSANSTISNEITFNNKIKKVEVVLNQIEHSWVGDLKMTLTNVNTGTSVVLMNMPGPGQFGSDGDNFTGTILSDAGTVSIDSITGSGAPYSGTYYPSNGTNRTYLNVFQGEPVDSTWRLTVEDTEPQLDNGYLIKWSLKFETDESSEQTTYPFEQGKISINHNWKKITLNKTFSNPVIILSDSTFKGGDPVTTRIKNITPNSFEVRLQEPNYKNDLHVLEDIYYLVGEKGTWNLSNNYKIQFGTLTSNKLSSAGFTKVTTSTFSNVPIILPQIQSYNGTDWVVTRTKNITKSSFEITMQKEEKLNSGGHANEVMGWVAVTNGSYSDSNVKMESKYVDGVNHNFKNVTYPSAFSNVPNLITKLISFNGGDTANTRTTNLTNKGFRVKIQEEQSRDSETVHIGERVGYLAILSL